MVVASCLHHLLEQSGVRTLLAYDDWTPRSIDAGYWILHSMILQGTVHRYRCTGLLEILHGSGYPR